MTYRHRHSAFEGGGSECAPQTARVAASASTPLATASSDDPGAGVEPDAALAEVRDERRTQPTECALRSGGIQLLQYFAGAREAPDPGHGRVHIRTVVDRFADVGEGDVGELRTLQDFRHGRRIGERERVRQAGRDRCSEGMADSYFPLVA